MDAGDSLVHTHSLYRILVYAIYIATFVSFVIGMCTKELTSVNAFTSAYTFAIVGTLLFLGQAGWDFFMKNKGVMSAAHLLFALARNYGFMILFLGALCFLLGIFIQFRSDIIRGHYPDDFQSANTVGFFIYFSYIVTHLLCMVVTGTLTIVDAFPLVLIGYLSAGMLCFFAIYMYIEMTSFRTDGFTTQEEEKPEPIPY